MYYRLAETKYESAGMEYKLKSLDPPTEAEAENRRRILALQGIPEMRHHISLILRKHFLSMKNDHVII